MSGVRWPDEGVLDIDGVTYRLMAKPQGPDELMLLKPRAEVEAYERLIAEEQPRRIVELGVFGGGSTALLCQLGQPEQLAAVDLRPGCRPLDRFLEQHPHRVSTHWGVDQADVAALDRVMAEFDGPVDWVIDDASHLLEPTRISFDRLFPHLRPGGLYIIEDWGWRYQGPGQRIDAEPMTPFVLDLLIVAARRPRMIPEVIVDSFSIKVRRGEADLTPGRFNLASHTRKR